MHACVVIVPIPDGTPIESRYVAQALREAVPYIEAKNSLTKGQTIDPLRPGVVVAAWECQDDVELP